MWKPCVSERDCTPLAPPPLADRFLGSRGEGLEGALEEMVFSQNHWILGGAGVSALEKVRKKGEEGKEKLFPMLAALVLSTHAQGIWETSVHNNS